VELRVGDQDVLATVLRTVAQPVWVVDPDGLIRFANPAALEVLGYDSLDELLGRHSHETIHHHHPDGTPYPASECPMLLPRTTGERVQSDVDWFFRRDGSMFAVAWVSVPLEMPDGRGAVVAFNEVREREAELAEEQAALRRWRRASPAARRPRTSSRPSRARCRTCCSSRWSRCAATSPTRLPP
jgi:PAS domain S-box-containing protein